MRTSELPLDQILLGDCLKRLHTLPEESIDLVFADPPYNLQLAQDLYRPNHTKVSAVDDSWDQFQGFEAYDSFTRDWLAACRRVLKKTGTLWVIGSYHNIFRVGTILQDLDYWILNDIVWVKTNPMPNFRGVRLTNAHETLIWAQKTKGASYTFNYQDMKALNGDLQMRSDWVLPICTGPERIKVNGQKAHSTQKPEALLYRVLMGSTNPGDVVLDPFFGTGTTGAVAKRLRRHWIGIEQDRTYLRVAQERIQQIESPADDEALFFPSSKRKPRRIPFGRLLESGLIQPGQILTFKVTGVQAVVKPDGTLQSGEMVGSIHQVARQIMKAPANGWDSWFFTDKNGRKYPIDRLRKKILEGEQTERKP